jgi:hypothetical protein
MPPERFKVLLREFAHHMGFDEDTVKVAPFNDADGARLLCSESRAGSPRPRFFPKSSRFVRSAFSG